MREGSAIALRRDYGGFARAWDRLYDGIEPKPSMSIIPSNQADGDAGSRSAV